MDFASLTDSAILAELGKRIAQARLQQNRTQRDLAQEAGVSKATLHRIERGTPTQVVQLVKTLRALGLLENLDSAFPVIDASPVRQLEMQSKERKRSSSKRSVPQKSDESDPWSWGDAS